MMNPGWVEAGIVMGSCSILMTDRRHTFAPLNDLLWSTRRRERFAGDG
jgi:hypothetical protein